VARIFRILLVEDFEPFRRFVRLALQGRAELEVVGEASDGLEAVHKAKDLQPDLILLDIGLPILNGMEAASKIRVLAPDAKLLFVSLESSSAIVQEALRLGARGYVHKLRAQVDLLPAIEAILAGKQFVSSDLEFSDGTSAGHRHQVQFYSNDVVFLESTTRFIGSALKAGSAAIVLATRSHQESLFRRLKAEAVDIEDAIQQGTYTSLDAMEALSSIMVNGSPDRVRFFEILTSVIQSCFNAATKDHPRVAVFGECVGLLCTEGNTNAAIQLEKTGNDLIAKHNIDIMCAYPLSAFQRADGDQAFESICAHHTAVFSG
jgi:DNA-binding NarL/FixJ family response regulator